MDQIVSKLPEVTVKFCLDEVTWNKVIKESKEKFFVDSEGTNDFIVVYDNEDEFNKAIMRFESEIDFTVISLLDRE